MYHKMIKPVFKICLGFLIAFSFCSCSTYFIPVESLKAQFSGIDSTRMISVNVVGPIGEKYRYLANPITTIKCIDKKNNPVALRNGPSIEMRVTEKSNRKTIFYFDRIFVNNSFLIGVQSRFVPSITKTIPLNDISRIEVQDGKKNFRYIAR